MPYKLANLPRYAMLNIYEPNNASARSRETANTQKLVSSFLQLFTLTASFMQRTYIRKFPNGFWLAFCTHHDTNDQCAHSADNRHHWSHAVASVPSVASAAGCASMEMCHAAINKNSNSTDTTMTCQQRCYRHFTAWQYGRHHIWSYDPAAITGLLFLVAAVTVTV